MTALLGNIWGPEAPQLSSCSSTCYRCLSTQESEVWCSAALPHHTMQTLLSRAQPRLELVQEAELGWKHKPLEIAATTQMLGTGRRHSCSVLRHVLMTHAAGFHFLRLKRNEQCKFEAETSCLGRCHRGEAMSYDSLFPVTFTLTTGS